MKINTELDILKNKIAMLEEEYNNKLSSIACNEIDFHEVSKNLGIPVSEVMRSYGAIVSRREVIKNSKVRKWSKKAQEAILDTGVNGDTMTFHEIAEKLGMTVFEVKRIYSTAMRKLSIPNNENRLLWEYDNIGNNTSTSDMAGTAM